MIIILHYILGFGLQLEWNQAKLSKGYHFVSEFWILAHFYLKGIYLFVALAYSLLHKRLKNKWDILFWDNVRSTAQCSKGVKLTKLGILILVLQGRVYIISDIQELKYQTIVTKKFVFYGLEVWSFTPFWSF